jgi:hypothetical protein
MDKRKSGTPATVKTKRVVKRKNRKYIYPHDKLIALRTKMREANLREKELVRKMAGFLRKVLPDYTAERQTKNAVQESDTPVEIPIAVTPKRASSDAETIDLRELDKTPHFQDKQYGIRKGDTLMIGNSAVVDEPGVITVEGNRFKLTKGLWDLLTRNDVDTGTISPNDMRRYKSIPKMSSVHLAGYERGGNDKISRGLKYLFLIYFRAVR